MGHFTLQESLMMVGAIYFVFFALVFFGSGYANMSYRGWHINWEWVIIILCGCGSVMLMNAPKASWTISLSIIVSFFWICCFFGLPRKNEDVAKPKILYNLTINIQCYKKTFAGTRLESAEDEIEMYGLAIHRAKKLLGGKWHVIESGHLVRGFAEGVESRAARLDVDEVMLGLRLLDEEMQAPQKGKEHIWQPHMHMESGWPLYVWANENGLYVH